jgi:hypothetical protein
VWLEEKSVHVGHFHLVIVKQQQLTNSTSAGKNIANLKKNTATSINLQRRIHDINRQNKYFHFFQKKRLTISYVVKVLVVV